jgi:hypothetical protein
MMCFGCPLPSKNSREYGSTPPTEAVTSASIRIDRRLQSIPEDEGESRASDQRITFETPLGVLFQLDTDLRRGRLSCLAIRFE